MKALITIIFSLFASVAYADRNVILILDDSGSMAGKKLDSAKKALIDVVNNLDPETRVGVLLLNGGWVFSDESKLQKVDTQEIQKVTSVSAKGGTPLGKSIKIAGDTLIGLRKRQKQGQYQILVLTDGEATDGDVVTKVVPDVMSRHIRLDVIGIDMGSQHSLAKKVHSYREAKDAVSLTTAIEDVLAESSGKVTKDTDESDFELICAIPQDSAGEIIKALTNLGDDIPIGEKSSYSDDDNEDHENNSGAFALLSLVFLFCILAILGHFIYKIHS